MTSSLFADTSLYNYGRHSRSATDIKTGGEVTYIKDLAAISSECNTANTVAININSTSNQTVVTPISFPALIPLKAPCNYTVSVMISAMSDNGNTLSFYAVYKMGQLTAGGALTYVAPIPILNSSSTVTVGDLVTFTKNPTTDTIDLTFNPTNGGQLTFRIAIELINDVNF